MNSLTTTPRPTQLPTERSARINSMRDQLAKERFAEMTKQDLMQLIYETVYVEIPDDEIEELYFGLNAKQRAHFLKMDAEFDQMMDSKGAK